jgi:hypothetical protein
MPISGLRGLRRSGLRRGGFGQAGGTEAIGVAGAKIGEGGVGELYFFAPARTPRGMAGELSAASLADFLLWRQGRIGFATGGHGLELIHRSS